MSRNEGTKRIEEKIRKLPPKLQKEVEDYVESLIESRARRRKGQLKLEWRGALRDLKDKYTSVELQHRILQWWGD
jgi:hypothetical protein